MGWLRYALRCGGVCASKHSAPHSWRWRQITVLPARFNSVQPHTGTTRETLQPYTPREGSSLAELRDRGAFLPKPEEFDERLKPGFRGAKALFVFFLCNAIPFGFLIHYMREQRANQAQLVMSVLPNSAEGVADEALRVIRTSPFCFLMQLQNSTLHQLRVDPHPPEGTAHAPPTEPLPVVPTLERNPLTDILEAPPPGLKFVHFAVSRTSALGASVARGSRQGSLLYSSPTRCAYCTVAGQLSVLGDADSRRRYWKNAWVFSFPSKEDPRAPKGGNETAPQPPWANEDYILLRLAVSEVTVQAMVDGPQRWDERRIFQVSNDAGVAWRLVQR